jgi:hypothetical protein
LNPSDNSPVNAAQPQFFLDGSQRPGPAAHAGTAAAASRRAATTTTDAAAVKKYKADDKLPSGEALPGGLMRCHNAGEEQQCERLVGRTLGKGSTCSHCRDLIRGGKQPAALTQSESAPQSGSFNTADAARVLSHGLPSQTSPQTAEEEEMPPPRPRPHQSVSSAGGSNAPGAADALPGSAVAALPGRAVAPALPGPGRAAADNASVPFQFTPAAEALAVENKKHFTGQPRILKNPDHNPNLERLLKLTSYAHLNAQYLKAHADGKLGTGELIVDSSSAYLYNDPILQEDGVMLENVPAGTLLMEYVGDVRTHGGAVLAESSWPVAC